MNLTPFCIDGGKYPLIYGLKIDYLMYKFVVVMLPNVKFYKMSDFKQRLTIEKTELDNNIKKLRDFQCSQAFDKIDSVQKTLLNIQECAMSTYSQILLERIVRLDD